LKEGYLKNDPVPDSKIVRLTIPARSTDEEAIQPVVNPLAQHESNSRTRCALVCAAFIGLFSIFSFRLIYLQTIKHDEYAGLAAKKKRLPAGHSRRTRHDPGREQ